MWASACLRSHQGKSVWDRARCTAPYISGRALLAAMKSEGYLNLSPETQQHCE